MYSFKPLEAWVQSFNIFCIPTGGTHITSDICAGGGGGNTYHCDTPPKLFFAMADLATMLGSCCEVNICQFFSVKRNYSVQENCFFIFLIFLLPCSQILGRHCSFYN